MIIIQCKPSEYQITSFIDCDLEIFQLFVDFVRHYVNSAAIYVECHAVDFVCFQNPGDISRTMISERNHRIKLQREMYIHRTVITTLSVHVQNILSKMPDSDPEHSHPGYITVPVCPVRSLRQIRDSRTARNFGLCIDDTETIIIQNYNSSVQELKKNQLHIKGRENELKSTSVKFQYVSQMRFV